MYSRNIVCFVRIIRKHGVGPTFFACINGINSDIVAFEEHGAENAGCRFPLLCLMRKLRFVEFGVETSLFKKFVVRALLDYPAVFHNKYQVGILDCGQAVSDDE